MTSCSKQSYPTPRAARRALRYLRHRGGYEGAAVYKCPTCGRYHLGRDTGYGLPWWKLKEKHEDRTCHR